MAHKDTIKLRNWVWAPALALLFTGCVAGYDAEDPATGGEALELGDGAAALASGCTPLAVSSVSASTDDGNVPANAVDGSLSTRWSGYGVGAYLTVDLGAAGPVCGADIAWFRGDQRASTFTIAVSSDGAQYTTAYSGVSSGNTASYESYSFASVTARYVRITVNGNTQNDWASISELRIGGGAGAPEPPQPPPSGLFSESFSYPDGLITNEYAYSHPSADDAQVSPLWEVTSGSLFAKAGRGWSGIPDGQSPGPDSDPYNDSAVFRVRTRRTDFDNVRVAFKLLNKSLTTTSRTPAESYDGMHVFLRYQSPEELYTASINRRDNRAVIKKKLPGGPSNGGTYTTIGSTVSHTVPYGSWQNVEATIRTNANGSVTIGLYSGGNLVVSGTDSGQGGAPITAPGRVGFRGDNCHFEVDDFVVTAL